MWDVQSGIVVEKNRAPSVDQRQLQALQFSVRLIDLLSILLRCNDFTGIQKAVALQKCNKEVSKEKKKAVVDSTSSRRPNSDHGPLFGASLSLGSALEHLLSPTTELIITGCFIESTFHRNSQPDRGMVCCRCVE